MHDDLPAGTDRTAIAPSWPFDVAGIVAVIDVVELAVASRAQVPPAGANHTSETVAPAAVVLNMTLAEVVFDAPAVRLIDESVGAEMGVPADVVVVVAAAVVVVVVVVAGAGVQDANTAAAPSTARWLRHMNTFEIALRCLGWGGVDTRIVPPWAARKQRGRNR